MRRALLGAGFLMAGALFSVGRPAHHANSDDSGGALKVGGVSFSIPDSWQAEPIDSPARAGQWRIAPPRGTEGDGVEVVVIFFGPGVGGSAQENIAAWSGLVTGSDGRNASGQPQTHEIAGHKITQVVLSGSYAQASSQPGLPPTVKPAYSLLGVVVENSAGTIYWRVTGPAPQVIALEPAIGRVIDSLKPQDSKP